MSSSIMWQITAETQVRHLGGVREGFGSLCVPTETQAVEVKWFCVVCVGNNQPPLTRVSRSPQADVSVLNPVQQIPNSIGGVFALCVLIPKLDTPTFLEAQLLTQQGSGITESLLGCR